MGSDVGRLKTGSLQESLLEVALVHGKGSPYS